MDETHCWPAEEMIQAERGEIPCQLDCLDKATLQIDSAFFFFVSALLVLVIVASLIAP
ncbi:uncharacterized protein METZ01_LOCUS297805 [marine metagenome]|uniref:Uncharacterized protein n=1 Tax=marine metagenome TaxID=408172 RepID=A0A382MCH5_9ZZZZ